jgi:hypothetical protein
VHRLGFSWRSRTGLSPRTPTSCIPWKGTPKSTKTARPFAVPNPLRFIGTIVGDGLRTVQTPTSTLQPLISNRHTSQLKPIASHSNQTSGSRSNRHKCRPAGGRHPERLTGVEGSLFRSGTHTLPLLSTSLRARGAGGRRNQFARDFIPSLAVLTRTGDRARRAVPPKLFPNSCFDGRCGNTVGRTLASPLGGARPRGPGRADSACNLRTSGRTMASRCGSA